MLSRLMNDPIYLVVLQQPLVLVQEYQSSGSQEFLLVQEQDALQEQQAT